MPWRSRISRPFGAEDRVDRLLFAYECDSYILGPGSHLLPAKAGVPLNLALSGLKCGAGPC